MKSSRAGACWQCRDSVGGGGGPKGRDVVVTALPVRCSDHGPGQRKEGNYTEARGV